jgi:hypothetical protein
MLPAEANQPRILGDHKFGSFIHSFHLPHLR